jgi:hypothetical protein
MCSRNFADRGGLPFMVWLALAAIVYLLAIREFFAAPIFDRRVVVIGLILAAIWHVEFLRLPAGADDDIHRYVWDGHLQRLGYNPYLVVPSDPAVQALHTAETRSLNNPDLPSPYPPGAQLFFRAITAIHESTFALNIAFVLCDWLIMLVLLDGLRRNGQGAHLVLAYAWNPLLAIEVAGSGHIDIVGALLLVISVSALGRRWRSIAAVTFGLAVAVKFLPIVLLPLYWKRLRIRDAALAAAVVALLYIPFLNHGHIPTGSLGTYVRTFRFNGPVFAVLAHIAPPQLLVGLALLVGFLTSAWLRRSSTTRLEAPASGYVGTAGPRQAQGRLSAVQPAQRTDVSSEEFAWPMAASLLFAPVVFPWYLLWLLPFLTSASTLPIIIWTVSIIPVYVMWHFRTLGRPWGSLPVWVMLLEYGCVATAAAILWLRRSGERED